MYKYVFETHCKSDYLTMLKMIDSKGWQRKAIGDEWNCKYRIEYNMH